MIWQKLKTLFSQSPLPPAVFKAEWLVLLEENLPIYSRLPEQLKLRLHDKIAHFIRSTYFEGCGGLELQEEMILTVAAQACLLVVHREGEPYPGLRSVLLYPTTFSSVQSRQDNLGVISEEEVHRLGESWSNGTVVLAWDSVEHGARNIFDGQNVTLHEFAHQLDHEDGSTDGAPELSNRQAYQSWAKVFSENYTDFLALADAGKRTVMDKYGATKPAEFFAVATETFFEKPRQLHRKRPELYAELKQFYDLDPLEWLGDG